MPEIKIEVKNKIATGDGTIIVCDNTDYKVKFTFTEEWQEHETKTMRVKYGNSYQEILFTGDEAELPRLQNTGGVQIGVYAGNLKTTTPAFFDCKKSILNGTERHAEPRQDIYNQLVGLVESGILKGDKGDSYIITEADKKEIADALIYRATTETAPPIIEQAAGVIIRIEDSAEKPLILFEVTGKTRQEGTPTTESPIEVNCVKQGSEFLVSAPNTEELQRVVTPCDLYEGDIWNIKTGKVQRNTKVVEFSGTEEWVEVKAGLILNMINLDFTAANLPAPKTQSILSNYFEGTDDVPPTTGNELARFKKICINATKERLGIGYTQARPTAGDVVVFKAWLAEQYAAGTPVKAVYEIATPIIEQYDPQPLPSTYYPTTEIINSSENELQASIQIEYIIDTKKYIDKKFEELKSAN